MTCIKKLLCKGNFVLIFWITTSLASAAEPANVEAKSDVQTLNGRWLPDTAEIKESNKLSVVWDSVLTVTDDTFILSNFLVPKDMKGKFVLHLDKNPKAIDLTLDEFDMSEFGRAVKYPACTLPGIYKLEPNRLTLCFQTGSDPNRPTEFKSPDRKTALVSFVRADADFKQLPSEVTVNVVDSQNNPVNEAIVFDFMGFWKDRKNKQSQPEWKYNEIGKAGADGMARVPYEKLSGLPAAAHDETRKLTGLATISPASLQKGTVKVVLQPECHVSGTIACEQFEKLGKPIEWTNVYLYYEGRRIAASNSKFSSDPEKFEFFLPPGTYVLNAYGRNLRDKDIKITIPAEQKELQVPPISLEASQLVLLEGQTAPELKPVVGWKGQPVKLAEQHGKYVLIDFWGYWCGPCVAQMPVLIELHEKFADKGLTIVGVHVDLRGEVDTAEKLDEKIAQYKKGDWNGKDLPFSNALTVGKDDNSDDGETLPEQYGVRGYPTTVLIDKEGKVVGLFDFSVREKKEAIAKLEKLLGLQTSKAD